MNKRGCYCELWEKDPSFFEKQGVPQGYCGFCEKCKRPGHTRHYPGPVPYTGTWCDRCYTILAWTWPVRVPVLWIFLWIPLIIASLYFLFKAHHP